jgi:plastocyanin
MEKRRRLPAPVTVLATMLLMLAACAPDDPATVSVTVKSFKYAPDPITISVGDSITWTNEDPVGHTATATDDSFDTSIFFPDESATITFDVVGTFPYFCGTHPEMVGTVVVEPAE